MKIPTETQSRNGRELVQHSSLYQEFLAERDEILRHKWLESEKAGADIGFERALLDWIRCHRDQWRSARRNSLPCPSQPQSEQLVWFQNETSNGVT